MSRSSFVDVYKIEEFLSPSVDDSSLVVGVMEEKYLVDDDDKFVEGDVKFQSSQYFCVL